MFEAFIILWAQERLVLRDRWRYFCSGILPRILLPRIWLPHIWLPRILPRIDIWRVRRKRNKDWLPLNFGDFGVSFVATVAGRYTRRGGPRLSVQGEPLIVLTLASSVFFLIF